MNAEVYKRLCSIVYDRSGIRIKEGKASMVASRIARRLRALNLRDELEYVQHLESQMEGEVVHLLDAISTNVTSFFRESHHFDLVREVLPRWIEAGQRRFRFWSAACSSGEEPYTLAMTLLDAARRAGARGKLDIRILATDISTEILSYAKAGLYSERRMQGVPPALLKRHFHHRREADQTLYEVSPELREMVVFRRMNLSQPPFPMRGPMDMVFCRNVMIYFDDPVKDRLINEFHRLLRPDGYLLIGHSESLTRAADRFTRSGGSVYRPTEN
jgi:chemotaxis protein methyltransferase CheR